MRVARRAHGQASTRARVLSVLQKRQLDIVYQPALRLDCARVEFFEALARFRSSGGDTPESWFSSAADVGLGTELEIMAARCALQGIEVLPESAAMSINLSPAAIVAPEFSQLLETAPLERVIVEITERQPVGDYERLLDALKAFRNAGLRIAVDDAGAGHSSFRHILHIRPDIIKLDMSLCRGIDRDPMRQALVSALLAFSRQVGSELVAEGVETAAELKALSALGTTMIQGHIVAPPMAPHRLMAVGSSAAAQARRAARAA